MAETTGIHHVTAIGGDPTRNARFYVETLGLRLVKRTVNHDDTGTYHLYFGDGEGTPGTNITFFPWTDDGRQGEFGAGQTQYTAYAVPEGSLGYWADRLAAHGVDAERVEVLGQERLRFSDPDGIGLELVATDAERPGEPWADSPVPAEHQLLAFAGVTLALADPSVTGEVLEAIGYERVSGDTDAGITRYDTGADGLGTWVDLVGTDTPRGRMGVGTVHHVAFRLADEDEQRAMQDALDEVGMDATEIIDRTYFRAIYAREPGGVLFEFATMGPGFDADEPVESLGERLALPEWLEDEREEIEAALPAFEAPTPGPAANETSADD
ncbi:VOC family protein [Haloglomus litoreum]|uniref:VOC family protein n=1 Tax=Haloglomus litoreum TaxID=3034026 RepID=UPI0023E8F37E|nr:VOC family protein [Haloglomus sp. DT116]